MGNEISTVRQDHLAELGDEFSYEKGLSNSRYVTAIRARYKLGPIVVKVHYQPADNPLNLHPLAKKLKSDRDGLLQCPNVLPYQRILETERAGYLIRQYLYSNLYDRISTRPFLTTVEKKWIAFQLLTAVKHAHEREIFHGDIRLENILVTTSNWVYLTDFSPFKPTHLPLDDPSVFSLFFDTSGRRICYIAPERFYEVVTDATNASEPWKPSNNRLDARMDIFSLGCALAELWMEGTPPFTLSQLFKYRQNDHSIEPYLEEIDDIHMRNAIRSMIAVDPRARLSAAQYLEQLRDTAFPASFYTFFHPFIFSLMQPSAAADTSNHAHRTEDPLAHEAGTVLATQADHNLRAIYSNWRHLSLHIGGPEVSLADKSTPNGVGEAAGDTVVDGARRTSSPDTPAASTRSNRTALPTTLGAPLPISFTSIPDASRRHAPAPVAIIALSLICSNLRNTRHPSSVQKGIAALLSLYPFLTDEERLDRLVPYLVTLLPDEVTMVRAYVVRALTEVLQSVETLTPSNAAVFTEYILPNTKALAADAEVLPRVVYAFCLPTLAETGKRFLALVEAIKSDGGFQLQPGEGDGAEPGWPHSSPAPAGGWAPSSGWLANYDTNLSALQSDVAAHTFLLLADPSPLVKRALLPSLDVLCRFFGRARSNDVVLSHLVTYLNTRDWMLRRDWNACAARISREIGPTSLEQYILPLVVLSLTDAEEFVAVAVLETLSALVRDGLLARPRMWDLCTQIVGLLCHPNRWLRRGAAAFFETVALALEPTERWCLLYPVLKRLLRADILEITAEALLENAREPLARPVFEAAVAWAARSTQTKSAFWAGTRRPPAKGAPRDSAARSEDDTTQLERLRQLGMKTEDEYKIGVLKDFILKIARTRQAYTPGAAESPPHDTRDLFASVNLLQDLGVVPQTVFYHVSSAAADEAAPVPKRVFPAGQPLVEELRRRLAVRGDTGLSGEIGKAGDAKLLRVFDGGPQGETETLPGPRFAQDPHSPHSHTPHAAASSPSSLFSSAATFSAGHGPGSPPGSPHLGGIQVGRAQAAVGETATSAMGMFDVDAASEDPPPSQPQRRIVTTYEGQDPYIQNLIERVCLDSYREETADLGPYVPADSARLYGSRQAKPAAGEDATPIPASENRPQGVLSGHLVEHTGEIIALQVSPDHVFFVSASRDNSVKVWDTARLEKNVTSRSRCTIYSPTGAAISCVCMVHSSHCVAIAYEDGSLAVYRIDVSLPQGSRHSSGLPRYGKPVFVRQKMMEDPSDYVTSMTSYVTDTRYVLVIGTVYGNITLLDVNTMTEMTHFDNSVRHGPVSALYTDSKHTILVSGTERGICTLYDLRFGLALNTWRVALRRVHQIAEHPSKGRARWVIICAEDDPEDEHLSFSSKSSAKTSAGTGCGNGGGEILQVWDLEKGTKVEEFCAVGPNNRNPITLRATASLPVSDVSDAPSAHKLPSGGLSQLQKLIFLSSAVAKAKSGLPPSAASSMNAPTPTPHVRAFATGINYYSSFDTDLKPDGWSSSNASGISIPSPYILTAGEDRKIRFWDLTRIKQSTVICGIDVDQEKPTYSQAETQNQTPLYIEHLAPGTPGNNVPGASIPPSKRIHRSTIIAQSQQTMLKNHTHGITAMCVIDNPFKCIVSGDMSGAIRCYK